MQKKKLLLLIFSLTTLFFTIQGICYSYQTIIIDFPIEHLWKQVYNKARGNEKIVQYVPENQTYNNWNKTFIFHSYKYTELKTTSPAFLRALTRNLEKKNATAKYIIIKNTPQDAVATRCIASNENIKSQCDILRVTLAQEAVITIQYINKNSTNFKKNYQTYLDAITEANPYYSYWRYDRVMSKGTSFEL